MVRDTKNVTLTKLRKEIEEGLVEIASLDDASMPDAMQVLNRYLHTPNNHVSKLFSLANLNMDDVAHWKLVLWYVSGPIFHHERGRSADTWSDEKEFQLLLHASMASLIIKQRLKTSKARMPEIAAEVFTLPEYKKRVGGVKARSASTLVTAIYRVIKKYDLRMRTESWRRQYEPKEIEAIESALNNLRSKR